MLPPKPKDRYALTIHEKGAWRQVPVRQVLTFVCGALLISGWNGDGFVTTGGQQEISSGGVTLLGRPQFRGWYAIGVLLVFLGSDGARAGQIEALANAAANDALETLKKLPWSNELRDQVRKNKWHPIWKKQRQDGDTCGYYALSHALSGFDKHAPRGNEIFDFARRNGWYWKETGSSISKNLRDTVEGLGGYQTEHGWGPTGGTMKYLRALVRWRWAVLVGVQGINDNGLPIQKGIVHIGGHWVAVEGFLKIDGKEYLIIKDSNHYGGQPEYIDKYLDGSNLWPVDLFEAAWNVNAYVALKPAR